MKLSTAYARFYKSFNFDHARKLNPSVEMQQWEMFRETFYPYVTVPLDPRITTVVGANESGKSQLLDAIKKAITGVGIEHRDLCRYSPFFGVAAGLSCWPHVGVGWDNVSLEEAGAITDVVGADNRTFTHFLMFREEPSSLIVWLPGEGNKWTKHPLTVEATTSLVALLPKPFEIKADVALPNSIPFDYLATGDATPVAGMSRARNRQLIDAAAQLYGLIGGTPQVTQANFQNIFNVLHPLVQPVGEAQDANQAASLALGRSLLLELGNIDPKGLAELAAAMDSGQDGYAGGLLRSVNRQLERQLNFKRYWVQDRDFSLRVATRDRELVFTISDRTGTEYTFSERSSGLRYFLSYLIQAQVHRPAARRESILLMDEPDTYLSAEAQQDLMRVFRDLAEPPTDAEPIQVIYVTHSPFLLDKNHAERIRVLEKGTGYDGTRVVPNVSRNHYEPLRSAFGAFVGETAFVGSVNLLVEGAADQILLAGAASETRRRVSGVEEDTLDLNRLVIVPCGSAGEVPYTVFRIRGQGADKPPVVVLLDSDTAGLTAAKQLKTDKRLKKLVSPDFVLDLDALGADAAVWPSQDGLEIEDLVPTIVAHAAVDVVIQEVTKFREGPSPEIALAALEAERSKGVSLMDAINAVMAPHGGRIDKIAFAKAVVHVCAKAKGEALEAAVELYLDRMRVTFRAINKAKRAAEKAAGTQRLDTLVDQHAKLFALDNPAHASREKARIVLDEIEHQLDDSIEADAIRNAVIALRRDHSLSDDPSASVGDYLGFLAGLEGLKHALRAQTQPVPPPHPTVVKPAPIPAEVKLSSIDTAEPAAASTPTITAPA